MSTEIYYYYYYCCCYCYYYYYKYIVWLECITVQWNLGKMLWFKNIGKRCLGYYCWLW